MNDPTESTIIRLAKTLNVSCVLSYCINTDDYDVEFYTTDGKCILVVNNTKTFDSFYMAAHPILGEMLGVDTISTGRSE